MIITKELTGARCSKTVYAICNSIADTGADRPDVIARFDTLETAILVLKYMRGDELVNIADEQAAREAIKKASVPTVESKHTRKAE